MKNIRFVYLYRDAGNYKSRGEVIFSNPSGLTLSAAALEFQRILTDGLFIADQIRLPEVLTYLTGDLTPDDHCFHEFHSVELTSDAPNDRFGRAIGEFLTEVTRESLAGWHAFDPYDRLHSPNYASQPLERE